MTRAALARLAGASRASGNAQLRAAGVRPRGEGHWPAQPGDRLAATTAWDRPDLWTAAGQRRVRTVADLHVAELGERSLVGIPIDLAAAVLTLALPSELLLAVGADDRQIPARGRSSYGTPLYDEHQVLRGSSCTVTPPDTDALAAAEAWRTTALARLLRLAPNDVQPEIRRQRDRLARRFLACLGLTDRWLPRLVLSASGTDVEALVAAFALGATSKPVLNVLVGAREAGRGTRHAASGRYFHAQTPFTAGREVGAPIPGLDVDRLDWVDVEIRDRDGRARRGFDIDAEIEAHVEYGLDRGRRVIVHVIAGSKTGLHHPEAAWVRRYREGHPGELRVVVDAAQGRLTAATVRDYLDAGASVFMTGSKALSGPAFCSALLLADDLYGDARLGKPLARGLADFVARADLPVQLEQLAPGFEPVNYGLLARWHVALTEWERLLEMDAEDCDRLVRGIGCGLRARLGAVPGLDVLPSSDQSIVCFRIADADGWLGKDALSDVYRRVIAARGVYIGQPVELVAGGQAALRFAVGATTVTRALAKRSEVDAAAADVVDLAEECLLAAVPVLALGSTIMT
jgi:hypothetical protein